MCLSVRPTICLPVYIVRHKAISTVRHTIKQKDVLQYVRLYISLVAPQVDTQPTNETHNQTHILSGQHIQIFNLTYSEII